jgi:GH35 family endo-1,4-beta-xylanase
MLGDVNAKSGTQDLFKLTIEEQVFYTKTVKKTVLTAVTLWGYVVHHTWLVILFVLTQNKKF